MDIEINVVTVIIVCLIVAFIYYMGYLHGVEKGDNDLAKLLNKQCDKCILQKEYRIAQGNLSFAMESLAEMAEVAVCDKEGNVRIADGILKIKDQTDLLIYQLSSREYECAYYYEILEKLTGNEYSKEIRDSFWRSNDKIIELREKASLKKT